MNYYNHNTSIESLQNNLDEQIAKLNELRSFKPAPQKVVQETRYYLDCGNKKDWVEFLNIHYNLTEEQMFDDYKLFLQAKAEVFEDTNKEKLEAMKAKLSTKKQVTKHESVNKPIIGTNSTANNNKPNIQNNTNIENKGDKYAR